MQPGVLGTLGFVNATTQAPLPGPGTTGDPSPVSPTATSGAGVGADGRSARWREHRSQRRAELLDVARHVIHDKGPEVTMEDIAVASGTSKSIIYRYFQDKAQLQRALGMHILSGMHERLVTEIRNLEVTAERPVEPAERIHAMVAAYIGTAQRSPHVYAFITRPSDGLNHFLESVTRLVTAIVPPDVPDAQIWAAGAVGFVEKAVDRWMRTAADDPDVHSSPDATQLSDHLVTWLMKGMQ